MNTKSSTITAIIALIALTLSGCSSTGGVVSSLEDLSTESIKEGWVKIPQYRVASISGWLPFSDVGGLYFYKPDRKPSSVLGLSPDRSFELISEIPSTCDEGCLSKIRDELAKLGTTAQQLVQSRYDLSLLQANQDNQQEEARKTADSTYKVSQSNFDNQYEVVLRSLKENGVFIYRWSTNNSQTGQAGLDSILGVSGHNNQKFNGFALVSGLKTKVLFVGNDLLKAWNELDATSRFSNRFEITTYVMQANHIIYGNMLDIDSLVQAKLKASYQQLANAPETLKSLTQIEIQTALSKISNLSNAGVMGKMKRSTKDIDWSGTGLRSRLGEDTGLTFFSVESDFPNILELLKRNSEETNTIQ